MAIGEIVEVETSSCGVLKNHLFCRCAKCGCCWIWTRGSIGSGYDEGEGVEELVRRMKNCGDGRVDDG